MRDASLGLVHFDVFASVTQDRSTIRMGWLGVWVRVWVLLRHLRNNLHQSVAIFHQLKLLGHLSKITKTRQTI